MKGEPVDANHTNDQAGELHQKSPDQTTNPPHIRANGMPVVRHLPSEDTEGGEI